jgi:hypothetical protein
MNKVYTTKKLTTLYKYLYIDAIVNSEHNKL